MKGLGYPGIAEQVAELFAGLYPGLAGVAISPLMKEASAGLDRARRRVEDGLPIGHQVQDASENRRIEMAFGERKSSAFASHQLDRAFRCFAADFVQHGC